MITTFSKQNKFHLISLLLLLSNSLFSQQSNSDFVFTIVTDNPGSHQSDDSTFMLRIHNNEVYNFDLDIDNDGIFDSLGLTNSSFYGSNYLHIRFPYPDTFTLRIRGQFPRFNFINYDGEKLISVDQWGTQAWTSMERGFYYCENLISLPSDTPNLSLVDDMSSMFYHAESIVSGIAHWDVSNVINMNRMFEGALLFNDSIGNWNVSNVQTTSGMFCSAEKFDRPLNNWDVSSDTNMYRMFEDCHEFNQDLDNWDVSSVSNMEFMFKLALRFNGDISTWNTSSVKNIGYLFQSAGLFNRPIGSWDVSSVTDMDNVFNGASSFNQDLSNWDVSSAQSMRFMFASASNFNQNIGSWNILNVADMLAIFSGTSMNVSNYDSVLIGWQQNAHLPNVTFGGDRLYFCNGDSARSLLIADGWTRFNDTLNCSIVGLNENKNSQESFQIFPNPSNGNLNISTQKKGLNHSNLLIYNSNGQLVYQSLITKSNASLDLNFLDSGLYMIHFEGKTKKLLLTVK